jgi:hypothetical protein
MWSALNVLNVHAVTAVTAVLEVIEDEIVGHDVKKDLARSNLLHQIGVKRRIRIDKKESDK